MPSGSPEFIPVTGLKCSYGKIFSALAEIPVVKTKISGAEPVRPLRMNTSKFTKDWFKGKARSRKTDQPGPPASCEEALYQKFSYFVFGIFSVPINKQLGGRAWKRGWSIVYCPCSLVSQQIYHRSTSLPIKYTMESMLYCSHLLNAVAVNTCWLYEQLAGVF